MKSTAWIRGLLSVLYAHPRFLPAAQPLGPQHDNPIAVGTWEWPVWVRCGLEAEVLHLPRVLADSRPHPRGVLWCPHTLHPRNMLGVLRPQPHRDPPWPFRVCSERHLAWIQLRASIPPILKLRQNRGFESPRKASIGRVQNDSSLLIASSVVSEHHARKGEPCTDARARGSESSRRCPGPGRAGRLLPIRTPRPSGVTDFVIG